MWWGRYFVSEVLVPHWLLLYKAIVLYTYILYVHACTQEQMYIIFYCKQSLCVHIGNKQTCTQQARAGM